MPKSAISSSNTELGSEDHTKLRRHDSLDLESSRVKGQCPAHHSAKVRYSFLNLYYKKKVKDTIGIPHKAESGRVFIFFLKDADKSFPYLQRGSKESAPVKKLPN